MPPIPVLLVAGLLVMLAGRAVMETLALRRLRDAGGRDHDMPRVASYFHALDEPFAELPARAWADLDLDEVFQKIDRTASWPGQHLLYARLRREDHTFESLRRFEEGVTRLADDAALRARIRAALQPLDAPRAGVLPALFQGAALPVPAIARVFPLLTLIGIACLAASFRWPLLIVAVVASAIVNAVVRVAMRGRIDQVVPAVRVLPAMRRAARTLAALDVPTLAPQVEALRGAVPRLALLDRAARWLSFEPTGANEIAGYLYEYLNILFLLDVTTYAWSVGALRTGRDTIRRAYVALGELDAMQAVATLRAQTPRWTRPVFHAGAGRALAVEALVHPLLHDPVPNSLAIDGRSVLLTGSNMSGKSTFIRTLGVNAVLAQTIGTVFATAWRGPRFEVRTSIGRADSLLEGTSYYRAEVDAVGALLAPRTDGPQRLVLIDELFRGTNSIERVAAAHAVLVQLDRQCDLVVIATHDVELLELLPTYEPRHFREEVRDGALSFDYQLRPGACSTRNALAILALAGFPTTVVADARTTAARLERRVIGGTTPWPPGSAARGE